MKKQLIRIAQLSNLLWVSVLVCVVGQHQAIAPDHPFWLPVGLVFGLAGLLVTHRLYKLVALSSTEIEVQGVLVANAPAENESEEPAGQTTLLDNYAGVDETIEPGLGQEVSEPIQASENPPPSALHQYLVQFAARYGGLYQFLQAIPVQLDASEKQQVRRWLVEMGLHAHSLARAYKMDPTLTTLTEEPNVLLILNDKPVNWLPDSSYRTFVNDPHLFDRRYQFIQQVLREMDLGELKNVLAQKIYIAPPDLTPPH